MNNQTRQPCNCGDCIIQETCTRDLLDLNSLKVDNVCHLNIYSKKEILRDRLLNILPTKSNYYFDKKELCSTFVDFYFNQNFKTTVAIHGNRRYLKKDYLSIIINSLELDSINVDLSKYIGNQPILDKININKTNMTVVVLDHIKEYNNIHSLIKEIRNLVESNLLIIVIDDHDILTEYCIVKFDDENKQKESNGLISVISSVVGFTIDSYKANSFKRLKKYREGKHE